MKNLRFVFFPIFEFFHLEMKLHFLIVFLTLILSSNAGCPAGFEASNGSCYYLAVDGFLNWSDAADYCQSRNSNLTSVKTSEEYSFLKGFALDNSPLYPVWIGLHRDPAITGYARWIWLDDSTPANKSFFNKNPIENDGCISWRTLNPNDGFETISCFFEQPFICKTAAT